MKRSLLVALIAMLFGLAHADTYTFALVPKAMNNPFFDLARDGCNDAAAELDEVECLYIGPGEHTELEQVQIVQDLITQGVDGIAVSPSNSPAMARVAAQANAAGIPVITWDSDFVAEDFEDRVAYVGTKNYDIGVNLAKRVMELKPDGGTICIQSGGAAAANHNERMQGIRDTLAGAASDEPPGDRLEDTNGWTELAGCPLFTNDDFPLSVQQMDDILSANPDLDAFVPTGGFPQFVPNAYSQVAEKFRDTIADGSLALVVADTLPVQIEFLNNGLSLGQVGQRPYAMGYNAMHLLLAVVSGEEIPEINFTGLDVCTPENADTCVSTSTDLTYPDGSGDDAEGDDAEGDDAEGDDAEGDDAEGDDAEGDDAEGDDAEGDDAEGDDAEGDDAEGGDMDEGHHDDMDDDHAAEGGMDKDHDGMGEGHHGDMDKDHDDMDDDHHHDDMDDGHHEGHHGDMEGMSVADLAAKAAAAAARAAEAAAEAAEAAAAAAEAAAAESE